MPFEYVASTEDGKLVKGMSELASRDAVVQDLANQGLVAVSVDHVRRRRRTAGRFGLSFFGYISHLEKVVFTKHLTVMIKAGLSLLEALRILRDQTENGRLRRVLEEVVKSVEQGQSLSAALAAHPKVFSAFFINVIAAGESAGTLEGNLEHLSEQFTKDHELRAKVRNALLYPAFVIAAALAIGFFFALYVIPEITGLFRGLRGVELPLATRAMIAFANFVSGRPLEVAGIGIGGIAFLVWFLRRRFMRPLVHGALLKMPIFGKLVSDVNLALFSLVLGTQIKSGIPIVQAMEVSAQVVDNWHFQKAIRLATEGVKRGNTLSESLAASHGVLPDLLTRMIEVGERSGRLEDILGFLSDFYSLEVETKMKNLTTVLEPVLLLVIGLLALGLAYAIIIPIYNFVSAIGDMGR